MKSSFRLSIFFTTLLFVYTGDISAQTKKETRAEKKAAAESALRKAIENRAYCFTEIVTGTNGRITPHTLVLEGDSLDTDFTRFTEVYNAANQGLPPGVFTFGTSEFDYLVLPGKRNGWDITITSRNQRNLAWIGMHVSTTGLATARVHSQRGGDQIYYGTLTANRPQ